MSISDLVDSCVNSTEDVDRIADVPLPAQPVPQMRPSQPKTEAHSSLPAGRSSKNRDRKPLSGIHRRKHSNRN